MAALRGDSSTQASIFATNGAALSIELDKSFQSTIRRAHRAVTVNAGEATTVDKRLQPGAFWEPLRDSGSSWNQARSPTPIGFLSAIQVPTSWIPSKAVHLLSGWRAPHLGATCRSLTRAVLGAQVAKMVRRLPDKLLPPAAPAAAVVAAVTAATSAQLPHGAARSREGGREGRAAPCEGCRRGWTAAARSP